VIRASPALPRMNDNPDAYQTTIDELMSTSSAVMGMVVVGLIMILAILTAVAAIAAFLFTMTLFRVPEEHRRVSLGSVWLSLIPVYGLYRIYLAVMGLADSFVSYFRTQDPDEVAVPKTYGRYLGLLMVICAASCHVAAMLVVLKSPLIVGIALGLCSTATIVVSIAYFTKVMKIRNLIPDPETEIPEDYL